MDTFTNEYIEQFSTTEELKSEPFRKNIMELIAELEYLKAKKKDIFATFSALINHQLTIAINIRRLLLLRSDLKTEELLKNIANHDSDKLKDYFIIKCYIAQKYLLNIAKILKDKQDKIKALSAKLRMSHGLYQKHHAIHYDKPVKLSNELIVENVSDTVAIASVFGGYPGDFYHDVKLGEYIVFSTYNDDKMCQLYDLYKEIYKEIPNSRQFILSAEMITIEDKKYLRLGEWTSEALDNEQIEIFIHAKERNSTLTDLEIAEFDRNNTFLIGNDKKKLEPIIANYRKSKREAIIFSDVGDGLDKINRQLMNIMQNLYYFFERKWLKATKVEKEETLKFLATIVEYKLHIFNSTFNLREQLVLAVKSNEDKEIKIAKVAAILDTMCHFQRNYGSTNIIKLADRCGDPKVSIFVRDKSNNITGEVKKLEERRRKSKIFPLLYKEDELSEAKQLERRERIAALRG